MVTVLRNPDQTIKTFSERGEDFNLLPGETIEENNLSFANYAGRLRISAGGLCGETLRVAAGSPDVMVSITCPGRENIPILVNDEVRDVALVDGQGSFILPVSVCTTYIIKPFEQTIYCPAGEALMVVVVE
jgi:hypothetical protein